MKRLPSVVLTICLSTVVIHIATSCKKEPALPDELVPELSLDVAAVDISAPANSTASLNVTSNTNWEAASSETWLTVSPSSGAENATVTLTAEQNTNISARSATVTFEAADVTPKTVEVTQSGSGPSLLLSSESVELGAESSSTATFEIQSNTTWTISGSEAWFNLSTNTGFGNQTITVTALETVNNSRSKAAPITVTASGAGTRTLSVRQNGIPCRDSDDASPCEVAGCTVPEMPAYADLTDNAFLPDPFTFMNGTRVASASDWACRRAEIAHLAQEFQYGYKPCTPYEATTATFAGNAIAVTVEENGKSITFNCTITYPRTGTAPYPAMIGIGLSFLDNEMLSDLGVAVINFPNNDIAQQNNASSRGNGKFYDLYCEDHSAGALMAWAWGVSRLIDALEKTPTANIDATRLGVTGCSRNGKGALAAGAFDERIVLTVPQESGSGGSASWRVSDFQGSSVQRLQQIVGENCWFRANFSQFSTTANKLPYDHHMILALCAPRALLVVENTSMVWLGNLSTWTTANAAHTVWEALGIPDQMGFSQFGHGNHCNYPVAQRPELQAYVEKFLVGTGTANTNLMKTDGNLTYDAAKWVNWTVPTLN